MFPSLLAHLMYQYGLHFSAARDVFDWRSLPAVTLAPFGAKEFLLIANVQIQKCQSDSGWMLHGATISLHLTRNCHKAPAGGRMTKERVTQSSSFVVHNQ